MSLDSTTDSTTEAIQFQCNICDAPNRCPRSQLGREIPSCQGCKSTVRGRALMRMLSREIFGIDLRLPDFPVLKGIRGLGMSDSLDYANRLTEKFDYRNTYYDREPKFDITQPDERELGSYDFIISSEVLEHVVAPVENAFLNLRRLLKPNGVLLLTVPYRLQGEIEEHFGQMSDYGFAQVGGRTVLVRKANAGNYQVFDNVIFHGGQGTTLEMRVFSETSLKKAFHDAGFGSVHVYSEECVAFGVIHHEPWSLPLRARNQPFTLGIDSITRWSEQWLAYRDRLRETQAELSQERGDLAHSLTELNRARNAVQDAQKRLDEKGSELNSLRADVAALKARWWYRLGRKLRRMP